MANRTLLKRRLRFIFTSDAANDYRRCIIELQINGRSRSDRFDPITRYRTYAGRVCVH